MNDLNAPGVASALAERISNDIDEHCIELYDDGHRNHLGASLIGDECSRKLWYVFRWVMKEQFDGRMLRLFNRGHKEEDRLIEWLEGIGVKVWADDLTNNELFIDHSTLEFYWDRENIPHENVCQVRPEDKELIAIAKAKGVKFPQYRISDVMGHFGGSLDGIARLPERYGINEPVLTEYKTSNEKQFKKLKKDGVTVAKPQHYAQMCTYGNKYKLNWALYMCICKDTDEIYIKLVKLDHNNGQQMIHKAERVICSQTPPPKLSQSPTFWKCKFCSFSDICHENKPCERNCRSCVNAIPTEGAQWHCNAFGDIIPAEVLLTGCKPHYKAITDNVQ